MAALCGLDAGDITDWKRRELVSAFDAPRATSLKLNLSA
jgi:hypothetical protein